MKFLRTIVVTAITISVLLGIGTTVLVPASVGALTAQQEACQAIGNDQSCNDKSTGKSGGNLTSTVSLIINVISIAVGVIAVIMIIWGGMKYITSGGDSNKVKSAKDTILFALIGLVIVALAQFIVRFVLNQAAKAV